MFRSVFSSLAHQRKVWGVLRMLATISLGQLQLDGPAQDKVISAIPHEYYEIEYEELAGHGVHVAQDAGASG